MNKNPGSLIGLDLFLQYLYFQVALIYNFEKYHEII